MLPIKDSDSIMISEYPKYDKTLVFDEVSKTVDKILEDIVEIRNIKATNKITKDAFVIINESNPETLSIFTSQLKITDDKIINEPKTNLKSVYYESANIKITYFFESDSEDETKKQEEIKKLKESIARREKLLSNENYVNKAPKNIVDMDKQKLEEEKQKLELLIK